MSEDGGQQLPAVASGKASRTPVKLGLAGYTLSTLEEAFRFGQYVAKTAFYPALKTPEHVVVALQLARDANISFSLLASNVAFINNRPCVWGDALIGIAHASGAMEDFEESLEGEGDNAVATCRVKRKGIKTEFIRTFSWKDAKAAQLTGKDPWQKYPKRMLQMRARSWALRDAGLTQGIIAREEAEDIVLKEADVIDTTKGLAEFEPPAKPEKEPVTNGKPKGEPEKQPEAQPEKPSEPKKESKPPAKDAEFF